MSTPPPPLHCNQFVELVTDYLEGALSVTETARLETHLGNCDHCAHYLAQLQITLDLAGHLAEHDVTPAMRGELLQVFSRWNAERT